jgi:hypothetical protein
MKNESELCSNEYIVETSLFKELSESDRERVSGCFIGLSGDILSKFPDEIKRQAWDKYSYLYGVYGIKYANLFLEKMKEKDWSKYDLSEHSHYKCICDEAHDFSVNAYMDLFNSKNRRAGFGDFDADIPF